MRAAGRCHRRCRARGASLLAVMTALSLSLAVSLASLQVMAMSNGEVLQTEQAALMDEQAAYVFDLIARLLQHAGHVDPTRTMAGRRARPFDGALAGHDNALPANAAASAAPTSGAHLGSDLLELRLAGDESGLVLDCAGLPVSVPAPDFSPDEAADPYAGVSQLYVAADRAGEPELRCRTRAGAQWSAHAVAAGVAGFQLLYGLDTDRDGLPNDFVSATALRASDAHRPSGQPAAWTRVVAVQVALLLRSGRQTVRGARRTIDLFGPRYADLHGSDDPGVRLTPQQLDAYRQHKRYDAVIFLRNSLEPSA